MSKMFEFLKLKSDMESRKKTTYYFRGFDMSNIKNAFFPLISVMENSQSVSISCRVLCSYDAFK